jgi:hypothetical protein
MPLKNMFSAPLTQHSSLIFKISRGYITAVEIKLLIFFFISDTSQIIFAATTKPLVYIGYTCSPFSNISSDVM